jgi:hypothetical protein
VQPTSSLQWCDAPCIKQKAISGQLTPTLMWAVNWQDDNTKTGIKRNILALNKKPYLASSHLLSCRQWTDRMATQKLSWHSCRGLHVGSELTRWQHKNHNLTFCRSDAADHDGHARRERHQLLQRQPRRHVCRGLLPGTNLWASGMLFIIINHKNNPH